MSEMFVRERLKAAPSEEAIALMFGPKLKQGLKYFPHMLRAHKAQAVMLARQGIVMRETGAALVTVLNELERDGYDVLDLDPKLEDLFYNVEKYLTKRLGARVAGQLHTGRSRNDLSAALHRMYARERVLETYAQANELRQTLLELAGKHTKTVMPGYTHLKPGQPITFGHYLSGVASALERDTHRVACAYQSTNLSPLGAAALAGTSFPIDRRLTADLLGFDGLLENTIDAVASRDYVLEFVAALAILTTTISRAATDLYIWQSDEYDMVELGDAIASTSSIMPQKKNPGPLEAARGRAAQVYGALMACLAGTKNTIFTDEGESAGAGTQQMDMAVAEAGAAISLLSLVARNLTVKRELMVARAAQDYCAVTDLADHIVRSCGVSFREAHAVVGGTVQRAVTEGLSAQQITLAMLNIEARHVIGRDLGISEDDVKAALDPMASVRGKLTCGGPAPAEVTRMVMAALERVAADKAEVERKRQDLAEADRRLDEQARAL